MRREYINIYSALSGPRLLGPDTARRGEVQRSHGEWQTCGGTGAVWGNHYLSRAHFRTDPGQWTILIPHIQQAIFIQPVSKRDYQLVDADAAPKSYTFSTSPIILLLELPSQQAEDRLSAEQRILRTLQRQLQQREDELEELKAQNKLTLDEYQRWLQQLYDDQQNNEKLIADMAKEYSQMDNDQLGEINRLISDAILNVELAKADLLLHSKGDIHSRMTDLHKEQRDEKLRKAEIMKEKEDISVSKKSNRKKLEDIAQDSKKNFDCYKLANQHDSAAYYIELRAELDTTNAEWLIDAGYYSGNEQKQYQKAIPYFEKAIHIYKTLSESGSQSNDYDLAKALNILANLYKNTQRIKESETMYLETLDIPCQLAKSRTLAFDPDMTMTLSSLANLAYTILLQGKYAEAKAIYRQYKDELKDSLLNDFRQFEEASAIPEERKENAERIKQLLNE